jgi:energy-coupling factor transport system substrate-specific component
MWGNLGPLSSGSEPNFRDSAALQIVEYVIIAIAASAACAAIIAWWADALGLVPFTVLGPIIITNNSIASVILGPPLLYLTYPRIKEMGLLYHDVMRDEDLSAASPSRRQLAAYGMLVIPLVWLGAGVFLGAAPGATSIVALGVVGLVLFLACAAVGAERLSTIRNAVAV